MLNDFWPTMIPTTHTYIFLPYYHKFHFSTVLYHFRLDSNIGICLLGEVFTTIGFSGHLAVLLYDTLLNSQMTPDSLEFSFFEILFYTRPILSTFGSHFLNVCTLAILPFYSFYFYWFI
jgi:hypothetical protein